MIADCRSRDTPIASTTPYLLAHSETYSRGELDECGVAQDRAVTHPGGGALRRSESASVRERVRSHRQRLREQGLRPIQIWVPDVRSPEFVAEAHRQSLAVARSKSAADDQAFVDAFNAAVLRDGD
jgi:hypothetical protein